MTKKVNQSTNYPKDHLELKRTLRNPREFSDTPTQGIKMNPEESVSPFFLINDAEKTSFRDALGEAGI